MTQNFDANSTNVTEVRTNGQTNIQMDERKDKNYIPVCINAGVIIKGRNSFANLRKTMIYNTNIDLVNDNVYTKFGLNRSISFQDIEQKLNSDVNQGP